MNIGTNEIFTNLYYKQNIANLVKKVSWVPVNKMKDFFTFHFNNKYQSFCHFTAITCQCKASKMSLFQFLLYPLVLKVWLLTISATLTCSGGTWQNKDTLSLTELVTECLHLHIIWKMDKIGSVGCYRMVKFIQLPNKKLQSCRKTNLDSRVFDWPSFQTYINVL